MEMDGCKDGGKHRSRGYTMSSNKRLHYLLLLLLAFGAATLSVSVLHKMRERRVFSILLQEREHQLMSLQALLENEKEISKDMRRKVDELEAKTSILSIERTELKNKVMNSETTTTYLTNTQKELEAALVEKEKHINQMKEIVAASGPDQLVAIKELLQKKEAELDEIKTKFQDNKKPDTEDSGDAVLGTNNESAASDHVALENSESSGDTIPASTEEHHSYNTTASESNHQEERVVVSTNNEDVNHNTLILEEKVNPSDSIPSAAEELHSHNTTASEGNHQEDSSSEEQFIKFTTNFEDVVSQEKRGDADANQEDSDPPPNDVSQEKTGDANQEDSDPPLNDAPQEKTGDVNQEDSNLPQNDVSQEKTSDANQEDSDPPPNDAPQEKTGDANQDDSDPPPKTHLEESELHHLPDSQEVGKDKVDGARKLDDTQGDASNGSSESKLLEKQDGKEVDTESGKEINPESDLKISKDGLSETNQEIMQVAEPVVVPADVNPSMPTNNDETKETSRRHRKRRSRSKRRKRTDVAASNVYGEVIKER